MDFSALLKLKQTWDRFRANHPKFAAFLAAIKDRGVREGMIIELSVKYPDGSSMRTNLSVTGEDVELLETLSALK